MSTKLKARTLFRSDPQYQSQIAGIVRGTGDAKSISDHIRVYELLERQWDEAMARQESLSRSVFGRPSPLQPDDDQGDDASRPAPTGATRMAARPFEEFRGAVELAQKCIRNALPLTTRRFIENLDRSEVAEVETRERQIARLEVEMRAQEEHILNYLPLSLEDVSAKLKFLVSLMLNGPEIETDYFAFLVEECAEVMDGSIGHLRAAAAIAPEQSGW